MFGRPRGHSMSRTTIILHRCIFALLLGLLSCSRLPNPRQEEAAEKTAVPVLEHLSEGKPKCLSLVKAFCENLYSPDYRGNISMDVLDSTFEIRRGRTKNDFSQIYYEYAQTQIKQRNRLPNDLLQVLNGNQYFKKLSDYLGRKPLALMTLDERIDAVRRSSEIETTWTVAINETVIKRMERQFDGYSRIPDEMMPPEIRNEAKRVRRKLLSEIARAIWTDHPNWRRVQSQFREILQAYRQVISSHRALPKELKNQWLKRLAEVRLILPGSDPEVDMLACARTEDNAYYYSYRNYVTVCAGDFNAENMLQTLAHEVAHALDIDRDWILFENSSKFGKELSSLFDSTCSDKKFRCENWTKIKTKFSELLASLEGFKPGLVDFNRCLKGKTTTYPIPDDYLLRVAGEDTRDTVSELAENNVFLKIITPVLPMVDGTFQKNPMYLNPCAYFLWNRPSHSFDETLTTLVFFVSEYRCTEDLPQQERFRQAIDTAAGMQTKLSTVRIRGEGEFSSRRRLVSDNYSASPSERFADNLAGLVLSKLLSEEKNIARRRALYLSNTTWSCPRPSIQRLLPDAAKIEQEYFPKSYSDDFYRQKEMLSAPIRGALACERDFEIAECRLEDFENNRAPAVKKTSRSRQHR